jgi:hypothetical protein
MNPWPWIVLVTLFSAPSFSVHGIEAYQPDGDRTECVNDAWFRTLLKTAPPFMEMKLIPKILTDGVRPGPQNTHAPVWQFSR